MVRLLSTEYVCTYSVLKDLVNMIKVKECFVVCQYQSPKFIYLILFEQNILILSHVINVLFDLI